MPHQTGKRIISAGEVYRIFSRHTLKYLYLFGLGIFGVIIQQATYVLSPLYLRDVINLISTLEQSPQSVAVIMTPLVLYAALSLIGWAGGRMEMGFGIKLIAEVTKNLTQEAFSSLMRHSHNFFASSFTGALVRRVGRYSHAFERLFFSFQNSMLPAVLYIVGITTVLLLQNVVLGLVLLVWVIVFILAQLFLIRWQRPLRLIRAQEDSNVTATIADSVSNQHTVVLFANTTYEESVLRTATERLKKAVLKVMQFDLFMYGVQGLLSIVVNVGMLYIAVIYWQQGALTVGDFVLIQTYIFGLFNHVWGIGKEFRVIYASVADASEMIEILNTPYEIADKKGAKALTVSGGEVWFDDVSFRFGDGKQVLHQLNFRIAPGKRVALVGPSGAGKSTVTKLLLRLYDVDKGEIKIDGHNIADATQESVRDAIAFVPQEPILFHRTLMENIRYGRRDATDAEVIEAAKAAHCHEFIQSLSLGYETLVGERGIKLSGGERQRVAIARAILKDAPILVLDEATSSLDSESEAYIQDALETLMKGKTVITVAHRLSTIMKMDRIVVMEGGAIVAMGTHLELIREQGLYQKLWSIQAGGFLGDGEKPKEVKEDILIDDTVPLADTEDDK